jgi:hypothetical protein
MGRRMAGGMVERDGKRMGGRFKLNCPALMNIEQ